MSEWHIITCELSPQIGGVAAYTSQVAAGLAATGARVHIWCPAQSQAATVLPGVVVHPHLGSAGPGDLRRVERLLGQTRPGRRMLVQWVPQGYGYRSMNLFFCIWLWRLAARGESIHLMVHEAFLGFRSRAWRQNIAALVHRVMMVVLLRASKTVWVSIPAWSSAMAPCALRRRVSFRWLPVPSNIVPVRDAAGVTSVRRRYASDDDIVIGHFGTYGRDMMCTLDPLVPKLALPKHRRILLIGKGSEKAREKLTRDHSRALDRIHATGALCDRELSLCLQACDLMVQPYSESGVSTRRTTVMAALAHGVATITTKGRHTEPVWEEHDAVRLVTSDDVAEIVTAVAQLEADATERSRLGRRGRVLYENYFDVTHTIQALRQSVD